MATEIRSYASCDMRFSMIVSSYYCDDMVVSGAHRNELQCNKVSHCSLLVITWGAYNLSYSGLASRENKLASDRTGFVRDDFGHNRGCRVSTVFRI